MQVCCVHGVVEASCVLCVHGVGVGRASPDVCCVHGRHGCSTKPSSILQPHPTNPTPTILTGRAGGAPDRYTGVVCRQQVNAKEGRILSVLPWGRLVVYCTQRGGIHAVDPRAPAAAVWSMQHPASEVGMCTRVYPTNPTHLPTYK